MEEQAIEGLAALPFLKLFTAEAYYYITGVLMLLIHVGFLAYEGGVARSKNFLATMLKNLMTVPIVGITFFFFGFWVYNAFPLFPVTGPLFGPWTDPEALTGVAADAYGLVVGSYPWSEALAPTKADELTGVFWMVFALFAMTTASILSGAVIERIQMGGYYILAIVLGSFCWVVAAAWGWNYYGWWTTEWGWHDFGCAVVVHGVSGMFALGVLINLGPRIGRFVDGKPQPILPHNISLTLIGLFLIFIGFFFFLADCVIFLPDYTGLTTIYGGPVTLATLAMNVTLALSAGLIGGYLSSRADPFLTISGGLAGIITVAGGLDLYHPALVIVLAFGGAWLMPKCVAMMEKFGIDDVVGAVPVHGITGMIGGILPGIFAAGYIQQAGQPPINLLGQVGGTFIGAILLGFVPGYLVSLLLKAMGLLRVSPEFEEEGLDLKELGVSAYPEQTFASAARV